MNKMKPVILTGLRANNDLHIGNYLGALLPLIDMAKQRAGEYQINLFVPDLHSFTTPIDHSKLQDNIMQTLRVFVAAGLPLDQDDVHIYRQSYIPAHSELTWILDCFASFFVLRRMQQFEQKAGLQLSVGGKVPDPQRVKTLIQELEAFRKKNQDLEKLPPGWDRAQIEYLLFAVIENWKFSEKALARHHLNNRRLAGVSVGLFNYPVLMAADILLYNASYVPVGEDQTQHLEFTRDIAIRMNNQFGELFTVPEPVAKQHEFFGKDQGLRIKDLVDPTKKMSKSDETGRGVIFLTDTPEEAAKKIKSATTDSFNEIRYDMKERPGVSNLLQILALFTGRDLQDVIAQYEGQTRYGDLKQDVAEAVGTFLRDFQAKLVQVDNQAILAKLEKDEAAMREQANRVLLKVQRAVGLRPAA